MSLVVAAATHFRVTLFSLLAHPVGTLSLFDLGLILVHYVCVLHRFGKELWLKTRAMETDRPAFDADWPLTTCGTLASHFTSLPFTHSPHL